jgi:hypothetical protein
METDNGEDDGALDVIDENPLYTLAGTDEGWEVWDRAHLSKQPMVRYPPTDDGFELAARYFERANRTDEIRRAPWMDVLRRAALIAGASWFVLSTILSLWLASAEDELGQRENDAIRWLGALEAIAYPAFLVSVAAYVLFWLRGQQRL